MKVKRLPVEPIYAVLGSKVRVARIKVGLTQSELGLAIKISRQVIASIEVGRHRLLLHHLLAIEEALGVSLLNRRKK